jgi:hypothetical protein
MPGVYGGFSGFPLSDYKTGHTMTVIGGLVLSQPVVTSGESLHKGISEPGLLSGGLPLSGDQTNRKGEA